MIALKSAAVAAGILVSSTAFAAEAKITVLYAQPKSVEEFDKYYFEKHMPMVKARMGAALKFYAVEKGIAGGSPGDPATYVAVAHLHCDSIDDFQRGFDPHTQEIMGDIPNYTDQTPVVQISEVLVEKG